MQKSSELSVVFLQLQSTLDSQKVPHKNVLAQVLIAKLQNWCMQLFWITVLCVINCCGEECEKKPSQQPIEEPKKRIADIERNVLRHLTSPMVSGPLRPVRRLTTKRRISSRPPSPQLFDIDEEE